MQRSKQVSLLFETKKTDKLGSAKWKGSLSEISCRILALLRSVTHRVSFKRCQCMFIRNRQRENTYDLHRQSQTRENGFAKVQSYAIESVFSSSIEVRNSSPQGKIHHRWLAQAVRRLTYCYKCSQKGLKRGIGYGKLPAGKEVRLCLDWVS